MKQFGINITVDPENGGAIEKLKSVGSSITIKVGAVIEAETMPEALAKLDGLGEVTTIQQRPTIADQVRAQGVNLPKVLTNMKTGQPVVQK